MGVIIFIGGFLFLLLFDYGSLVSFSFVTIATIVEAYLLGLMGEDGNIVLSCLLFAMFCLVWFAHRQNIFRLLTGKENRLNFKKSFGKNRKKKGSY